MTPQVWVIRGLVVGVVLAAKEAVKGIDSGWGWGIKRLGDHWPIVALERVLTIYGSVFEGLKYVQSRTTISM
jgi:hypothetical protein